MVYGYIRVSSDKQTKKPRRAYIYELNVGGGALCQYSVSFGRSSDVRTS